VDILELKEHFQFGIYPIQDIDIAQNNCIFIQYFVACVIFPFSSLSSPAVIAVISTNWAEWSLLMVDGAILLRVQSLIIGKSISQVVHNFI